MGNNNIATGSVRRRSWTVALLGGCAAAAIMCGAPAFAQQGAEEDRANEGERVVVTGSRLRGVEEAVGSPVFDIGREDIEESTVTTVDKLIQQTPQVLDLGVSEASRAQNGGAGNIVYGTGINLRGLGPYATLTLIDGHRAISNGRSIDPSFMPSLGLERIEVLADGASAVYGSDAIAGVVNLIPRRYVDGGQVFARYGIGDEYDERQLGASWGTIWDSGQAHFAYEYNFRSNLNGEDRDFFRADQRGRGGPDYRPTLCNPGNIVVGGVSYAIPAGGVTAANRASLLPNTSNRCETLETQDLLPEQEYNSYAATLNQEILPWLEFVADAFHTERTFARIVAPGTASLNVPSANAFFVAPPGLTPATETVQYNFGADFPGNSTSGFARNTQVTVSLVADLPGDWQGEVLATYGENRDNSESYLGVNNGALNAALGSANPATAFDPFGLNRTNPAVIAGIANQIFLAPTNNELTGYEARFDGPVFTMPGGAVRLAVGFERQEQTTHLGSARGNPGTPIVFRNFDRTVDSAYAEVFFPFFSSTNAVPGLRRLELNLAGRYDNYSDVGETTNPKIGINWAPIDDLTFRGSYGTSLRAPIFAELYGNSSALFAQNYSDPTAGNATVTGVALSGGNTALEPEEATTYAIGFDWEPSQIPGLQFGLGYFDIEYEGQIAAYLSDLTILRNESQFAGTGIILRGAAANQRYLDLRAAGIPIGAGTPPNPVTIFVDGRPQNLGVSVMKGFDFNAAYAMEFMGGDLNLGVDGTYLNTFDSQITPNGTVLDKKDKIFNPLDFKMRARADWTRDAVRLYGAVNHVGEYTNDLVTPFQNVDAWTSIDAGIAITPGEATAPLLEGGFTVSFDVRNLLDEEPPYVNLAPNVNGSGGFDATASNPIGRVMSVSLRKKW
ncbi:MAG TPA: TonB-dependent receptor [Hyphomonadaceae bacterium]